MPGRAIGATRIFTVTAVEADKSRGARAATSVNQQLRRVQRLELQIQIAPGTSSLFISARCPARGDLAAFAEIGARHFHFQRLFGRDDRDARFMAQT